MDRSQVWTVNHSSEIFRSKSKHWHILRESRRNVNTTSSCNSCLIAFPDWPYPAGFGHIVLWQPFWIVILKRT